MRAVVREAAAGQLRDVRDDEMDWGADKPAEASAPRPPARVHSDDATAPAFVLFLWQLAGLTTERERASEELGRPVYRALFIKDAV